MNVFFKISLAQASRLLGKPGRLIKLATQLVHRLYTSHRGELNATAVRERFQMLGRLVTAYAKGQYRVIPMKTMVAVVAAVIYFLNPFDLIPDILPGIGLTDDLAILTLVFKTAQAELDKFLAWEKSQTAHQTN